MKNADPAAFVVLCRALPEAIHKHVLVFAPLQEHFPTQMRDINTWK
jgi:hypothetical protein